MTADFDTRRDHYFVQRRRRMSFVEEWRANRRAVARAADVAMERSDSRNATVGVLAGEGSPVPMRMIDARIVELAPRSATSTHRHTHDDIVFVIDGEGMTEIGDRPYHWSRWDALHVPSMAWHRHRNDGDRPARLLAITDAPMVRGFGLARIDDIGDAPSPPDDAPTPVRQGASHYEREWERAAEDQELRRAARRHTRFTDVRLKPSPKGSRSALLVDGSLGYRTTGLSMAMFEIAPGQAQSRHRHPGEAVLYIVDGEGHSDIGDERVEWRAGDAAIVSNYVWHQHFNGSRDRPATVIRMHMWESVIQMMEAAMDPVPLYEDTPDVEQKVRAIMARE